MMIRVAHLVFLTMLLGASGAVADVVILGDGSRFPEIRVDRIVVAVGKPAFLAREIQDGQPTGTARPLDESRVAQIEFRDRGDTDARPRGRAASLTLLNGKRFEHVWVERCRRTEGGFVFDIREGPVPPGGISYPVSAKEIMAITFREADPNSGKKQAATTGTASPSEASPVSGAAAGTGATANPFDLSGGISGPPVSANAKPAGAPAQPASGAVPDSLATSTPPASGATDPGAGNASAAGVTGPPAAAPLELRPDQITRILLRRRVAVTGHVAHYRASWATRAPNILTLEYGGNTVDVVYWDDVEKALGGRKADLTRLGSWVRATGDVEDYHGHLQIRVIHSNDLRIVPDPTPSGK
jgi:hypothetical protein